ELSERKAEAVRSLAPNADIRGYRHTIDEGAVRHVLFQHGSERESERGPSPVTAEDFERIPDILERGEVESVSTDKKGLHSIVTRARVDDGYVYVEEVRTGRKALALRTMWKRPARSAPDETVSELSPEAFAGPLPPREPEGPSEGLLRLAPDGNEPRDFRDHPDGEVCEEDSRTQGKGGLGPERLRP